MTDEAEEPEDETEAAKPGKKAKKVKVPKPPKPPKPPKEKKAKSKGFNWVLVLIPIAVIAALVLAFTLPPTHALLVNGPLRPLFARFSHASPAEAVAAHPKKSADPAADIKRLSDALQTDRTNAAAKDAQIAQLHAQVTELQAPPKSTPAPAPKPTPAAISDDVKRTATYWAGMDADKAADIVKLLPDAYVKLVLSQMPPDAVSDIMSALPAKTAARLTASAGPE